MAPPLSPRAWRAIFAGAAGAALIAGGGAIAIGPGAAWIVDHGADGQRVWRLGRIRVDNVSGNWLGDLRAERITLEDSEGVWAEARDVAIAWRPFDLFSGAVRLDAARAEAIDILRQPDLTERRISSGARWEVDIAALRIDTLTIAQPVVGEADQFSLDFALGYGDGALHRLDLDLTPAASESDRAHVRYSGGDVFVLEADVRGEPDGVIARALGVPGESVAIDAEGDGGRASGRARIGARIGDADLLAGALDWTAARWTLTANGRLDPLPALDTLARRVGTPVALTAEGARGGAFTARAETPFLSLDLAGAIGDGLKFEGPLQVVAETQRLSAIAREAPFEFGYARFEGVLAREGDDFELSGDLDARELGVLGRRAHLIGPVRARLDRAQFALEADLAAPDDAPDLFAAARLETRLSYDRRRARFELTRAALRGDALALDARGWSSGGGGSFSGDWRIRRLDLVLPDVGGAAAGRWRANADSGEAARVWRIAVEGRGERVGGAGVLAQLLGASPNLDGAFRYEDGGITVAHARVDGAKLRAGATGLIVRGQADLAVEASARGPVEIGGASIAGVADGSGRLSGAIARPRLDMRAQMASIAAGGVEIAAPVLTLALAPEAGGYAGRITLEGTASGQPLQAQSDIALDDGAMAFTDLDARLGGLRAQGSARFAADGPTASLALSGVLDGLAPGLRGAIVGDASLSPAAIQLDAQVSNAHAGLLYVRAATLTAAGPYERIAAQFDMRGRLRDAPLAFSGTALVTNGDGMQARIEGAGELAGASVSTRTPMALAWTDDGMSASLNARVADGAVLFDWRERGRALNAAVTIEDAPIAPLAAIWSERATGRIDGHARLASDGDGLTGEAELSLVDARVAGRQRGALDADIRATLAPGRLTATLDARSAEGLVAHIEADAPVTSSAAPLRIALAPERRGTASWSITGPVETLWSAARLQDQALEGGVEGEGELSFGAGHLSGDGHIEIRDGRFEDKITGVKLQDVQARIVIGEGGVAIERFTAQDSRGGTLTVSGGSANPNEGEIAVRLADLRLVDRPDARARANGQLTLAWEGLHSSLTGDLDILEGDVSVAARPEAGIPQLDVIEINRPGEEFDEPVQRPPQRNGATDLDVRVRAPGRIYTRGRGIDAEWSLDLRLDGTLQTPRFYGSAEAVRGTLSISGQPFVIETGRIEFNGRPEDARINLAAERVSSDLTARILLTGTAADPDIAFTSDPALPEDEILPQILFGRSVADLSGLEAAQLAASLAALSGQASFDLLDAARAATGLDRFDVREGEDGGLLVAGGVYLTRDVYVEIARDGSGQAATRVEWTVRPKLVLITSFLPNGDQRASVRWRRESD